MLICGLRMLVCKMPNNNAINLYSEACSSKGKSLLRRVWCIPSLVNYYGKASPERINDNRVSHINNLQEVFKENFPKNFAKTTGKHKFTGLHCSCFPMNFQKHFQISYFIEHLWKAASTVLILLNFNYAWIWKCFDDFYTVFYHNLKMKFI